MHPRTHSGSPFSDKIIDRYRNVRALAERGSEGERDNARALLIRLEQANPGLREHVAMLDAAQQAAGGNVRRAPTPADWSKAAQQAADFLGNVFRDIQREAEQQRARKNSRVAPDEPDDGEDDEADEAVDEYFTITTNVTKAGKVTVKIELDADAVDAFLETYEDDEDGAWMVFQSVGARVAEELDAVLLSDEDDED